MVSHSFLYCIDIIPEEPEAENESLPLLPLQETFKGLKKNSLSNHNKHTIRRGISNVINNTEPNVSSTLKLNTTTLEDKVQSQVTLPELILDNGECEENVKETPKVYTTRIVHDFNRTQLMLFKRLKNEVLKCKEGYLEKKSNKIFKSWKQVYCRLKENVFMFYGEVRTESLSAYIDFKRVPATLILDSSLLSFSYSFSIISKAHYILERRT